MDDLKISEVEFKREAARKPNLLSFRGIILLNCNAVMSPGVVQQGGPAKEQDWRRMPC